MSFRISLPALLTTLWVFSSSPSLTAADHAPAPTGGGNAQTQRLLRDAAMVLLKEGNTRYVTGKPIHPSAEAERRVATATEGQAPLVSVLSCADSRVPVEVVFDRGVGDIFTVRVAGNVADTDEIATLEYGVGHLHTPLLVVMGHSKCGAVTAMVKGGELHGLLPQLLDNIQPAVERAKAAGGEEPVQITAAIKENVWQSMSDILRRSSVIRGAIDAGDVRMIGAIYDIETGKVEWIGEHPNQKAIATAASQKSDPHREAVLAAAGQPPRNTMFREIPETPAVKVATKPGGHTPEMAKPAAH